jgi:hypothetical protein
VGLKSNRIRNEEITITADRLNLILASVILNMISYFKRFFNLKAEPRPGHLSGQLIDGADNLCPESAGKKARTGQDNSWQKKS